MCAARYRDSLLATLNRPVVQRGCDFPGCCNPGSHRAPKSRDRLHDYYWFCLEHVSDYNARWDFLKGLSADEIEAQIRNASVWERPTWPMGEAAKRDKALRDAVRKNFSANDGDEQYQERSEPEAASPGGEREALAVLGLTSPAPFATIKAHYKKLVKKHHPDANGGSVEAEEKIKIINQAFTLLKNLFAQGKDSKTR